MNWYKWDGADLQISLHVQPRAGNAGIVGVHGDALKIKVKAPPAGGRANREVVALLAESFSVARSAVVLKSGAGGRRKQVRIAAPGKLPALPGLSPHPRP